MAPKRLGVLAVYDHNTGFEEFAYFRKLSREGKKLGLQIEVFRPDDVENGNQVRVLVYDDAQGKWVRRRTSFPPIVYDRCRSQGAEFYNMLQAFRKKHANVIYLSRPLVNKWSMHKTLSEDETIRKYLPATVRFSSPKDLMGFLKKHKQIYVKPKNGTGGRGILRIEQVAKDLYLMQGRNQQRAILSPFRSPEKQLLIKLQTMNLGPDYVVQQGIPLTLKNGRVHDYRLLIQKNRNGEWEVTGCAGRIGPHRSITSNLHGGGSAVTLDSLLVQRFAADGKIAEIKSELYGFAHKLAAYLENRFGKLCELGLDMAIDAKGNIWLIEVNPKPSREIFLRTGQTSTYHASLVRPLEYALWVLRQKKSKA